MAIAFDAFTAGTTGSGQSSITFSKTCTGADRFLIVSVTTFNFSSGTPSPTATYNGVTMTIVAQNVVAFNVNNWRVHQFYLKAPASGANNVVVTATTGTGWFRAVASSYTGVDQTSPLLTSRTANATSGNTMQVSLTTSEDAWWAISGANVDGNWTAGGNTGTIRHPDGSYGFADSNSVISATTGNAQMSHLGSRGYGGIAIAFKPAGAAPDPAQAARRGVVMMM